MFIGLVIVLAARRLGRLDAIDFGQAYAAATVAIAGSALLLIGLLLAELRPVALDAPVTPGHRVTSAAAPVGSSRPHPPVPSSRA